jgi:hypothetical protein
MNLHSRTGEAGSVEASILCGRVSDTSGNWLPDARVTLVELGVSAATDGNGLFEMNLPLLPDSASPTELLGVLVVEKDGHRPRKIRIRNRDFFSEFAEITIEPDGVGDDAAHLAFPLPGDGILCIGEGISPADDPGQVEQLLSKRLESVSAAPSRATSPADFYAWVPPGDEPLRAVFLLSLHGMGCVDHPVLRSFAEQHRVALVGLMGPAVQRGIYPTNLLDAPLRELGRTVGHPEIADLPALLFGHSNGTGHATAYTASRPERVIAWISYHSGFGWQLLLPGLERAPGLILHGQLDQWFENGQETAFRHLRSDRNAPVVMMVEGNVGHGPVNTDATWEFIVAFCEACMRLRLPLRGGRALREVDPAEGWLGEPYYRAVGGQQFLEVAPAGLFPHDPSAASWLPDEQFARVWQHYGTTDPRKIPTAPHA